MPNRLEPGTRIAQAAPFGFHLCEHVQLAVCPERARR